MIKATFTVTGADIHKMILGGIRVTASTAWMTHLENAVVIIAESFPDSIWGENSQMTHTFVVKYTNNEKTSADVTMITSGGKDKPMSSWSPEERTQKQVFEKIKQLLERNKYTFSEPIPEKINQQL